MSDGFLLVVDDNEMNRDMLSRRLQRQGYDVAVAENGLQALDVMQKQHFDLVLLDIMMPKMNGYEVLERIKTNDALRHVPVIMISAVDELDSVVKCIELGADDYLFKPFNPVLLKARVSASLEKKRLYEQAKNSGGAEDRAIVAALRTPFTALKNEVEALQSVSSGPLNNQQAEILNRIAAQVDQIARMLGA